MDPRHRSRLAEFISRQRGCQFLCATFRRELLAAGDRFATVTHVGGRESHLSQVSLEEAEQFLVREQQKEAVEEAERARRKKKEGAHQKREAAISSREEEDTEMSSE